MKKKKSKGCFENFKGQAQKSKRRERKKKL
jgi:hypothetical protein